jgi:hypothetical protein
MNEQTKEITGREILGKGAKDRNLLVVDWLGHKGGIWSDQ